MPDPLPPARLSERLAQRCRYGIRCTSDRVCRKVGVSRGGLHLRMAQQLADHRQSLAGRHGRRCKGVAQVVYSDVLEPGTGPDALPERLQVAEWFARQGAGNGPRVAMNALGGLQAFDRRSPKVDGFLAALGIRQA